MIGIGTSGRSLRLNRLLKGGGAPLFVVPLDHTVTDGPFTDNRGYDALLEALAGNGADAIVVHKGRLRQISVDIYVKLSTIVHISASTKYAPDTTYKYQIGGVEDCLRRGADAISVHVNLGSATEDQQLSALAQVADACDRLGLPLLAMIYPRGDGVQGHARVKTLAHAASLAADLGADMVKLPLSGPFDEMQQIVGSCPIPVLAAGGAPSADAEFDAFVADVLRCGASGIAAGRNIFMAKDPGAKVRHVRQLMRRNQSIRPDAIPVVPGIRDLERQQDHRSVWPARSRP